MCELTAELAGTTWDYNPVTGELTWKKCRSGVKQSLISGYLNKDGYLVTMFKRKNYKNHRIAWLITYGEWPINDVDHINGIRNDNRLINLRLATRAENMQNQRRARSDNRSGFLGVGVTDKKNVFKAWITIAKKNYSLGKYSTPEEAYQAYVAKKRVAHQFNTL